MTQNEDGNDAEMTNNTERKHDNPCDKCNTPLNVLTQSSTENSSQSTSTATFMPSGAFSYDMGWQKRGSGRRYDSNSGVGVLIGQETGKIVSFGTRIKQCRICSVYTSKKLTVPAHDCRMNYKGSSKAMEPDLAVDLIKDVESNGVKVGTIIMDEDTTTMARLKTEISHSITKWSDLAHVKKACGNALWKLASKFQELNANSISYLQRCLMYAVKQNKGKETAVAEAIKAIPNHVFGEHSKCGDWCRYNENPVTYKHRNIDSDFKNRTLKEKLIEIYSVFSENSHKLAPCGSTRLNESFNNTVASKAPKSKHYSTSESLDSRVQCAVAQTNNGYSYVSEVNTLVGISPGRVSLSLSDKLQKKRKQAQDYKSSIAYKRKKLAIKRINSKKMVVNDIREGVTYKSNVDLRSVSLPQDTLVIPDPINPPQETGVSIETDLNIVFFDLETTGLALNCDILQIAAIDADSNKLSLYVLPSQDISEGASNVTGITYDGSQMFLHRKPVNAVIPIVALQTFLSWIEDRKPVLLVAHNATFDAKRLIRTLMAYKLEAVFCHCVSGIADTLPYFKGAFPDLANYKQETLVKSILKYESNKYQAHNALDDVIYLKKLYDYSSNGNSDAYKNIVKYSKSTFFYTKFYKYQSAGECLLSSYKALITEKILSHAMCKKAAYSGLSFSHLKLAYDRKGHEGLIILLSEKCDGKVRVTNRRNIIKNLFRYFEAKCHVL